MQYRLQDLIDVEQFQSLQDRLNEIYSFPSAIIDNDGNILTATAWQDICTKFHRQHPDSEKECIKSDQYILSHLADANPAVSYRCPHGLVDNATPIIVEGVHLGNFFTGQFFLEPPDLDLFRDQARRFGFDEDVYLDAVRKVPIWTQEKLNSYLFFIKGLIEVITTAALKNLREIEAKRRIEEGEKQFRAMFEMASIGMAQLDPTTKQFVRVNQKLCEIAGYTPEEMCSLCLNDIVHPDDRKLSESAFLALGKGPAPDCRVEHRYLRKDGSVIWVNANVTLVRGEAGQPGIIMATFEDNTERKRIEVALRENEERYRTLFHQAIDGIFIIDTEGRIIDANPSFARLHGYHVDDLRTMSLRDLDTPATAALIPERMKALAELGTLRFEVEHFHRDGHTFPLEVVAACIRLGEQPYVLCSHRDLSERKLAENILRESAQQFRELIDRSPVAMAVNDGSGHTTLLNRKFISLFGYGQEDLPTVGDWWRKAYPDPDYRRKVIEAWTAATQKAARTGEELRLPEYRVTCKDGTVRTIQFGWARIGLLELVIFEDLTERKALEAQLQQAQKMEAIGHLAGGIAHDFNNLLQVILVNAELISSEDYLDESVRDEIREISTSAERATELTRQLLAFSRRQLIRPVNLDLNDLVQGVLKMLRRLIGEHIALCTIFGENLGRVFADRGQIEQVIMNICVNARDAMPRGGRLTIETRNQVFDREYCRLHPWAKEGSFALLSISDTGEGMDEATQARIFEPFFTTKELGKGTGLGLATVYGIVKQHLGLIHVYSEPNAGTVFKVYLPLVDAEVLEPVAESKFEIKGGDETILVAEDDPAILRMLALLLESAGYTVLKASNGTEAFSLFLENSGAVDLVLLDVMMPGLSGREVMNLIKEKDSGVPFLFSSGYSIDAIHTDFVIHDGLNLIQKPYSREVLLREIRRILDA